MDVERVGQPSWLGQYASGHARASRENSAARIGRISVAQRQSAKKSGNARGATAGSTPGNDKPGTWPGLLAHASRSEAAGYRAAAQAARQAFWAFL
jgi:hypothetical protein